MRSANAGVDSALAIAWNSAGRRRETGARPPRRAWPPIASQSLQALRGGPHRGVELGLLGLGDLGEEVGLVGEAGEHRAGRHAGLLGDVPDGGAVIAALREQLLGGGDNFFSGTLLGHSPLVGAVVKLEDGQTAVH